MHIDELFHEAGAAGKDRQDWPSAQQAQLRRASGQAHGASTEADLDATVERAAINGQDHHVAAVQRAEQPARIPADGGRCHAARALDAFDNPGDQRMKLGTGWNHEAPPEERRERAELFPVPGVDTGQDPSLWARAELLEVFPAIDPPAAHDLLRRESQRVNELHEEDPKGAECLAHELFRFAVLPSLGQSEVLQVFPDDGCLCGEADAADIPDSAA